MTDASTYTPPAVWTWNKPSGGRFASINRPIAGPTHDKELPVGRHPLQLYSLATPNGVKVSVMLEELLALGHADAMISGLTRPFAQTMREVQLVLDPKEGQVAFGRVDAAPDDLARLLLLEFALVYGNDGRSSGDKYGGESDR